MKPEAAWSICEYSSSQPCRMHAKLGCISVGTPTNGFRAGIQAEITASATWIWVAM